MRYDEPLRFYTTFKVGGNAEVFAQPENIKSFMHLLCILKTENVPVWVLGGGSNVVIWDTGITGFTVTTSSLNRIEADNSSALVVCEAGCSFEKLTAFCCENGLSGLEEFAGLPGSAGGAVYMNARCYEKSISDVLAYADYFVPVSDPAVSTLNVSAHKVDICGVKNSDLPPLCRYNINCADWDYKKSPFMPAPGSVQRTLCNDAFCADTPCGAISCSEHPVIVKAAFKVCAAEPKTVAQKSRFFVQDREKKGQFRYPSAGSVFKNNRAFGKPSGKLIDEAGLRGLQIGQAQVAPWHGNFIINLGGASADSIKELVKRIQTEVKKHSGHELECEILFY